METPEPPARRHTMAPNHDLAHVVSPIGWPQWLVAQQREMAYESIAALYDIKAADSEPAATRNMGFVVSCSKSRFYDQSGCQGSLHKLEAQVVAGVSMAQARLDVTHEVLPGRRSCAQIIPVTPHKLLAACFDDPHVIPIKNFGYKKTFNCDVRAGLSTGTHSLNCLATDGCGRQLAAGSTDGYVILFDVREEELFTLAKSRVSDSAVKVVGLEYVHRVEEPEISQTNQNTTPNNGPNAIIYATQAGCIGLLDARVGLAGQINYRTLMQTEPRLNLSSLCVTSLSQGNCVFFGSSHGQLVGIDLRNVAAYTHQMQFASDRAIAKMRQVDFQDPNAGQKRSCLVYTNGSNQLRFLDLESMQLCDDFICDRDSLNPINDFIKVDDRLITCGDECSIGCWLLPEKVATD